VVMAGCVHARATGSSEATGSSIRSECYFRGSIDGNVSAVRQHRAVRHRQPMPVPSPTFFVVKS
jgi:hypothetical protein